VVAIVGTATGALHVFTVHAALVGDVLPDLQRALNDVLPGSRVPPIGQVLGAVIVHKLEAGHADDAWRPASSSGTRLQTYQRQGSGRCPAFLLTHKHDRCAEADADVAGLAKGGTLVCTLRLLSCQLLMTSVCGLEPLRI
jgi:hypothetical protein